MVLTLANFEQEIEDVILQRGRQYFRADRVIDLVEEDEGTWSARVEGTEVYEVNIEQGAEGEFSCDCTCPYEWGPFCKHIAAVLYAIEETFPEYKENKPRKNRRTRTEKVRDILNGLTHEELVELLSELAEGDRQIANRILVQLSDEGGSKAAYVRLAKDALNRGKGQYGFIDYYGSGRAARGVQEILQRAAADVALGRVIRAVPVYQAVVETVVPAIAHADDSNGELGNCINVSLEGLAQASDALPPTERQKLFDYCLSEAPTERYEGWDWGWDLAQIAADMVTTPEERNRLYSVLDRMAAEPQGDDEHHKWLSRFHYERAEAIKLTVIDRLDDEATSLVFLRERVEIEPFRERLVRHHIESSHLAEARRLCTDWLEQPEPRHRGYQTVFLDLLLTIAQLEGEAEESVKLAEELFFDTGNFKYYNILKRTISDDRWPEFRGQLIADADSRSRHHGLVPRIFVEEQMWRPLLNYMEPAHRQTVDHYREYLEPRFPDEVGAIYERIVWGIMKEKANRKGYQEACRYLRRMKELNQEERVDALIEALRARYSNRPALLDELKKI